MEKGWWDLEIASVDATQALAGHLRGHTEQVTERFEGHVPRVVRVWEVWEHGKPCGQTRSQAYWRELPGTYPTGSGF